MTRHLGPALALSLLAGCAVGPDYHRPELALPAHYDVSTDAGGAPHAEAADAEFWQRYHDPQLSHLISRALAGNQDVAAALAHYDAAQALLRASKFDRYPTVTSSAQGGRQRVSTDQAYGYPRSADTYSAGINASWELDLFGRVRRSVEAQRANSQASASDLAAMQVAVVGETARTYFQWRGLQLRLRIAQDNVASQQQTLQLVEARLAAGQATEFDHTRARALLETSAAQLPAIQAQIAVAEHRLAVLSGQPPEAWHEPSGPAQALPSLPPSPDPGTPAELLRRRPDIAAAEQRLHAATAQIGVSTADLFPRLSLLGLLGSQSFHAGSLFNASSDNNYGLLGIDWSFLDLGRVRARISASRADAAAQLANYQQTVLLALEDTENALVRDGRTRSEDAQLQQAADDSRQAAQLARLRYQVGEIDLYELLDAERSRLGAEDAAVDSHTRSLVASLAVYQALAGGWPQQVAVADKALIPGPGTTPPADPISAGRLPAGAQGTAQGSP